MDMVIVVIVMVAVLTQLQLQNRSADPITNQSILNAHLLQHRPP